MADPPAAHAIKKESINLISITKSIDKIFIPSFVCVLTNERTGFSFCGLGHAPGVGWWFPGSRFFFFQIRSCGISNRRGCRAVQNANKIYIIGSNW